MITVLPDAETNQRAALGPSCQMFRDDLTVRSFKCGDNDDERFVKAETGVASGDLFYDIR